MLYYVKYVRQKYSSLSKCTYPFDIPSWTRNQICMFHLMHLYFRCFLNYHEDIQNHPKQPICYPKSFIVIKCISFSIEEIETLSRLENILFSFLIKIWMTHYDWWFLHVRSRIQELIFVEILTSHCITNQHRINFLNKQIHEQRRKQYICYLIYTAILRVIYSLEIITFT